MCSRWQWTNSAKYMVMLAQLMTSITGSGSDCVCIDMNLSRFFYVNYLWNLIWKIPAHSILYLFLLINYYWI
jgi:hypothetical protein